jgi:OsmC subfamily peroxiredoxin
MKRFGSAAWNGGLREGKGSVSTESRALETYPYTFFSRYGEKPGTNPEELLGAAHAACFTMSFVRLLGMADFVPEHPRSILPSPRRYRALTRTRFSRSQQRQRPAALFPS